VFQSRQQDLSPPLRQLRWRLSDPPDLSPLPRPLRPQRQRDRTGQRRLLPLQLPPDQTAPSDRRFPPDQMDLLPRQFPRDQTAPSPRRLPLDQMDPSHPQLPRDQTAPSRRHPTVRMGQWRL